MKISLLIYGDIDQTTGGYLYDRRLVKYLEKENVEIEIESIPKKEYLVNISDNFSKELYKRLTTLDTDLLLQDELTHPSIFHLNKKLKKERDYPIISIVHNLSSLIETDEEKREMCEYFERKYLKTIDGFVFNSKATEKSVKSLIDDVDGIVAYPGKDHIKPAESNQSESKDSISILFVGNILPHKGLDSLIRSISEIKGASLKVVGNQEKNPDYLEKIKDMIFEEGLESRVELSGLVSRDRLSNFYRESDLLAVPSVYEGFGLVYVESLGYGLPIIASNRGGAKEIIENGREGFLVEPGNVSQLTSYLEKMKTDEKMLEKMSKEARKRYEELPTWERSMSKVRAYLKSKFTGE